MIGEKIKKRRDELGLTQEELASKLGYKSKSTINKIELGINDISQTKVVTFAEALETTPAFLMGWEDEPSYSDGIIAAKLLKKYKQLTDDNKQVVNNIIDNLLNAQSSKQ